MEIRVPLARPTFPANLVEKYKSYVEDILKSGRLTLGPYTRLFEEKLAETLLTRAENVVAVSSGTAALHIILLAYGIGPGDEVIVPTYTFASTVNAPLYVGARPVLADSELDTYNISPDSVLELITSKTRAIIAVHIGGNPADMRALREIADDHRLILIEDAAHALGAKCGEAPCGTVGDSAAFSFYPNKVATTGEGGAIVVKDARIAEKARIIRNIGRKTMGPADVIELGYNYRMSELEAALGVLQLSILEELLGNRRKIAQFYTGFFSKMGHKVILQSEKHGRSSYYAYLVRLAEGGEEKRDWLAERLLREHGVQTTIIYRPVHTLSYYRCSHILVVRGRLENAEHLGRTSLALPIYGHMKEDEAELVAKGIAELLGG